MATAPPPGHDTRNAAPAGSVRPFWVAAIVLLGVALHLPSLSAGFYADDYVIALALDAPAESMPLRPWSLFDFGGADDWRSLSSTLGGLPWWTDGDWSIRFFRPLASLSLWLDHRMWGDWATGHHLVSLGLYALLLLLAHRLYLALGFAPRSALLGLALLALSDASVIPVGWLANRNALLVALFTCAALLAVLRRPDGPRVSDATLAWVLAGMAALSKESGAAAWLVVAAALWLRARPLPSAQRARLVPWAAAAALACVLYLGTLALAGFGTRSLFYATPWRDPLPFAVNAVTLASAGLLSLIGPIPLDLLTVFPAARWPLIGIGAVLGWPLILWIARTLRGCEAALLLALWVALALLPQAGAQPSDRLLFEASLGASGLLALFFGRLRALRGELPFFARAAGLVVLAAATVGSGLNLAVQAVGMRDLANHLRSSALASEVGPPGAGPRDVLVLHTENGLQGFTVGGTWHGAGGDPQVRFAPLSYGRRALRWTRLDERSFELESLGEPFLTSPFERVYRTRDAPRGPDEAFETDLLEVRLLDDGPGGPHRLRFTLARSLDDPEVIFVRPVAGVLTRVGVPGIGKRVELPEPVPVLPFIP